MTIKRYCDACGSEVQRNYVADRLKGDSHTSGPEGSIRVMVELTLGINGTWNRGEFCGMCALDAVRDAFGKARV